MFCLFYRKLIKFPHLENEIFKEPDARPSRKLSCNWLIMLVTMATPLYVKDKNSKYTARDEDMSF